VFGKNIDKNKVKVRIGVKHFLTHAFEKFYMAIWSCMKLEDVFKVLLMLILDMFMDQFVFIWGREQCLKTFGQIYLGSYCYLKDLKHVYYICCGLPYDKEDQT
jgi:tRNA U34 5-methylaminomethyl-2-thiouridine-forming methyltransferase MnmC